MIGQSGVAVDIELVEPGCSVFALDLEQDTDADANEVRGGIVVGIETDVDDDGVIQRRFITATPWRGHVRFAALTADEVAQVAPPNGAAIRSLIRAMAKVVATSKRTFTTDEARCIAGQYRLMEVAG